MSGRFAIDIETVSPSYEPYEQPPEFDDPQHFELLAVVLGYERADGSVEEEMLFRTADDPASELALITRTVEWLRARDGDRYLTYGGESFDVVHLLGRAALAADAIDEPTAVPAEIRRLLETELRHVDLQPAAWAAFGEYTRLDDACEAVDLHPEKTLWSEYEHGIDLDERRPPKYQGFEQVLNKDIPLFGERYLTLADVGATETLTFRSLHELLDHYGREDVAYLFELADARPF